MEGFRIVGEGAGEAFREPLESGDNYTEGAFVAAPGAAVEPTILSADTTSPLDRSPDMVSPLPDTEEMRVDEAALEADDMFIETAAADVVEAPYDPSVIARRPRDMAGAHARMSRGLPPDASIQQMQPVVTALLSDTSTVYEAIQVVFGTVVSPDMLMQGYGPEMRFLHSDADPTAKWDTLRRMSFLPRARE